MDLQDKLPDSVSLVTSHRGKVEAGKEVTIDYGDKSNEELLHLYGQSYKHAFVSGSCKILP